jgi:transcriptional regulator with XRE-family HTH domain
MQTVARFSGPALRQRRLAEGLSQSGLALRAGVREQQINRWEGGKNKGGPSADAVAVLASALRCEISDLFEVDGEESSSEDDEESELLEAAFELDRAGAYAMADRLRRRAREAARAQRSSS